MAVRGNRRRTPHVHPLKGTCLLTTLLWDGPRPRRVVVGTQQFHVYHRVQAWSATKCDAGPAFFYSKRPAYIVSLVPRATWRPPKPTKRNMCNHIRGVVAVTPQGKPQFQDVPPTLHDLRRQLTQANSAAETKWVLQAPRKHVRTTWPPCERLAEPRVAPKRPRLLERHLPEPSWRRYLDTALTLQLSSTVIKTRFVLTTFEDTLLLSSWSAKLALMVVQVERHFAVEYTRAKELPHRLYIESARRPQESAWPVQQHALHRHAHRRVIQRQLLRQQLRASLQSNAHLAYSAWMLKRLQNWRSVQGAECAARFLVSVQHVVELERTTCHHLTGQYETEAHGLCR